MGVRIASLKKGDKVIAKFHGSAVLGNEPHTEELIFNEHVSDVEAVFSYDDTLQDDLEVFFCDNRWRYGTSAEVFSVQEKTQ